MLTAHPPGHFTGNVSQESMVYTLGNYHKDKDVEKLIPLAQLEAMSKEVCDIFFNTLCADPWGRPSALQLLAYTALRDASCEQYFDIECTHSFEQEEKVLVGTELPRVESAEYCFHTPVTYPPIPMLVTGEGNDSDVTLDVPIRRIKCASHDSGVSSQYDQEQNKVYSVDSDSGGYFLIADRYTRRSMPPIYNQPSSATLKLRHSNSAPSMMADREAAEAGLGEKLFGRLKRSMSETYVDQGPDIDTPEEKNNIEPASAASVSQMGHGSYPSRRGSFPNVQRRDKYGYICETLV
jgi:hypothetical protein